MRQLVVAAQLLVNAQDRRSQEAERLLTALSLTAEVRGSDRAACNAYLQRLRDEFGIYANIGVTDASGQVVCHGLWQQRQTFSIAQRDDFQRATATRAFAAGEATLGVLRGLPIIPYALPLLDGERVRGVVFAALDLRAVQRKMALTELPEGARLHLVDAQGRVVAESPSRPGLEPGRRVANPLVYRAALSMQAGTGEGPDANGIARVFAHVPSESHGGARYLGLASVESAVLTRGAWSRLRGELGRLVLVLLLSLAGAWWLSGRSIVRPAEQLADAADAVARGALGTRVPDAPAGAREFTRMADSFNAMAQALQARVTELEQLQGQQATLLASLHDLNAGLEQRVAERTRELETFSYTISHDLRAPLASVAGFSRVLQERLAQVDDPQVQHWLARVQAGAARMEELIDALLLLARVTREPLQWSEVDLSALAREVGAELQLRAPRELQVQDRLLVHGDARLLRNLLQNLLGNAWKFSAGRPGAVEVGAELRAGERVFHVRDPGVGFDMARAGRLFEPFQRMHAADEFPGTGIGLATVQRIVARHGGRAWVQSAPDQGTTVCFTLGTQAA
jgi:signal transduction histidine kinase